MAYLGGRIHIDKTILLVLLFSSLLLAGLRMRFIKDKKNYSAELISTRKLWIGGLSIGALLGGLSGMIGIGGGIFLAPILYFLKWGKPKQIAVTCSIFILINSISGLIGQIQKSNDLFFLKNYFLLFVVVLIGGQIGGFLTSYKFSQITVRKATAFLILFASARIFIKVFFNA